jgi:hypothetical protein
MSEFKDDIEKVAKAIVAKVSLPDTPFSDVLEAMKVLNVYYGLRLKHKQDDDPEEGSTFGAFQEQLEEVMEAENGAAKVRSHRRTRPVTEN